jgi:peptidase E
MNHGLLFSSFSSGILPNPEALELLRQGLKGGLLLASSHDDERQHQQYVRVVYIPTAMYAWRANSTQSPGQQRQRARVDAKQRRNDIVALLHQLFYDNSNDKRDCSSINNVGVQIVTVDLDDGSVKHPECSSSGVDAVKHNFPKTGKEALSSWKPHLVYMQGGNTFWLHHCIIKGGWERDLKYLLVKNPHTFYMGASAGAIVAGSSMQTACWKEWDDPRIVPGMESYEDWAQVPGLGLVGDKAFFPHMESEWETTVKEKSRLLQKSLYTLSDTMVCYVDGTKEEATILQVPVPAAVAVDLAK